jgi:SOS-response transcriptional repressor LexA
MSSDDQHRAFEAVQRRLFEMLRDWPQQELDPTLDELAKALDVAKSTVHRYRQCLKDKGLAYFDAGRSRSTRITTDPAVFAAYGFEPGPRPGPSSTEATMSPARLPRSRRARLGGTRAVRLPAGAQTERGAPLWPLSAQPPLRLPVAGRIAAGKAKAFDRDDDVLEVDGGLVGPGRYTLRVTGDSMVDLGVFDGDQVIVDPGQPVHEGDLVAALLPDQEGEGLATIKVFARRDDQLWLEAANPAYPPILIEQNAVLGRVTTLVRRV